MLGAKNPLNNPFLGDTRLHPITRGFRVIYIKGGRFVYAAETTHP